MNIVQLSTDRSAISILPMSAKSDILFLRKSDQGFTPDDIPLPEHFWYLTENL